MFLSDITSNISKALNTNLDKPNKKMVIEGHNGGKREGLAYSEKCKVSSFEEFVTSETKVYVDKDQVAKFIQNELKKTYPEIDFFTSLKSHSTFTLSVLDIDISKLGFDSKYQSLIPKFIDISDFIIRQKRTVFGELSSYNFRIGQEQSIRIPVDIELMADFEVMTTIKFKIQKIIDIETSKTDLEKKQEEEFFSKLSELGISLEDYFRLKRMEPNNIKVG